MASSLFSLSALYNRAVHTAGLFQPKKCSAQNPVEIELDVIKTPQPAEDPRTLIAEFQNNIRLLTAHISKRGTDARPAEQKLIDDLRGCITELEQVLETQSRKTALNV